MGSSAGNKKIILRIREADKDIFKAIRAGKKKIETRAATPKYRGVAKGDELVFVCGKEKCAKKVSDARIFRTISALLRKYNVKDINPAFGTKKELEDMYESFSGYADKIKKCGIAAFRI